MKRKRIIYRVSTALLSVMMLMGAMTYFFTYDAVAETVVSLGYPTYIIYPLGAAKITGIALLWLSKSERVKNFVYAGFAFTFTLAALGHLAVQDGGFMAPIFAFLVMAVSYYYSLQVKTAKAVPA